MRNITRWMLATTVVLCTVQPPVAYAKHGDKTAAVIVGGLLLGAAALAASSSEHQHENQYAPPQRFAPPAAPFSPATNVTCYPREGACYNDRGDFLPTWTSRVF